MAVQKPKWVLKMEGVDVSKDLSPYIKSVSYIDRTSAESDEISVLLNDSDGRFANRWYPDQGTEMRLNFGYEGQSLTDAGLFELDEVNLEGDISGDTCELRALATVTSKAMRTRRDQAYENITLKVLAETVASRLKMTVIGSIDNSIKLERESQFQETDLGFLTRVAAENGHMFSMRGTYLVFTKVQDLHKKEAIGTIEKKDLRRWTINDTTGRTFRVASHRHFDARKGRSIKYRTDPQGNVLGEDEEVDEGYVESMAQAEVRANAKRLKITESQVRATITLSVGTAKYVAGANIMLKGFGKRDGKFFIETSTHTFTSSGYTTELEIYSVDL